MDKQEKITILNNRELKDIIHYLNAYKATIDKVFNETKKKKPFQNTLLTVLAGESSDVAKLNKKLEKEL